jgi:hypothetical protein
MGFHLAVWYEPVAISVERAHQAYLRLVDDEPAGLTPHPAIGRFHRKLEYRYPEFDVVTDDDVERSPWAAAHRADDAHVQVSIAESRSGEVARYVRELAAEHGLICFDPQGQLVHHPPQAA